MSIGTTSGGFTRYGGRTGSKEKDRSRGGQGSASRMPLYRISGAMVSTAKAAATLNPIAPAAAALMATLMNVRRPTRDVERVFDIVNVHLRRFMTTGKRAALVPVLM